MSLLAIHTQFFPLPLGAGFGPGLELLCFRLPFRMLLPKARPTPDATSLWKRDGIHRKTALTVQPQNVLAAALTQSRAAQPPPDPVFCAPRFVWPLRTSTATVSELLSRRAATLLQLCPRYLRSLRVTEGQWAPRAHGTVKLQHHPRSRGRLGTVVLSPRQQKLLLAPQKEGQKPAGLKSRDQYSMKDA